MLRTVNYCQMLSDDNPIKTMSIHVLKCFPLFLFFFMCLVLAGLGVCCLTRRVKKTLRVLNSSFRMYKRE